MDVIQPQMIWIGNRCYRKNPLSSSWDQSEDVIEEHSFEKEQELCGPYIEPDEYDSEVSETDVPVKSLADGRFRVNMPIPCEYFPKIIGRGGETKKQLEKETRTELLIPKKGQSGDLVIFGYEHKGVVSAYTQIHLLVLNVRKQLPKTHFISIPLSSPAIKAQFLNFQKQVISSNIPGIDKGFFQNPDKLHITIGLVVLLNDVEKAKASSILQSFLIDALKTIGKEPLEMELKGIDYMNDDPSQVNVLYGQCVDSSGRLQRLADSVVDRFEAEGLLDREYDHVKLHVTLMNIKFASTYSDNGANRAHRRNFNAKSILENFEGFTFGSQPIDVLHLSQRHTTSPSTGYYQSISQLDLKLDFNE